MSELSRKEIIDLAARKGSFRGLDLSGADLTGLDLTGLDFTKADLSRTHCRDTLFTEAKLSGATFEKAFLLGTNFQKCCAEHVDFYGAMFGSADFSGASLDHADFERSMGVDKLITNLSTKFQNIWKDGGVKKFPCTVKNPDAFHRPEINHRRAHQSEKPWPKPQSKDSLVKLTQEMQKQEDEKRQEAGLAPRKPFAHLNR